MEKEQKIKKIKEALIKIEKDLSGIKEIKDLKRKIEAIREEIEEIAPKKVRTHGDPIVEMFD